MDKATQGWTKTRRAAVGLAMLVGALLTGCASVDPGTSPGRRAGRFEPLPVGGFAHVSQGTSGPAVLLFQSERCPYCRAVMRSVRKGVAKGKPWTVYTVDVRQEPALRQQLGVGPVPCLVYFKGGQEVDRSTGWRPGVSLKGKLNRFFR